jgi:hypothetical protein
MRIYPVPKGVTTGGQESLTDAGGDSKTGHWLIMRIQQGTGVQKGSCPVIKRVHPRITKSDRIGIVGNDSEECIKDDSSGRYDVHVVSPQLKEGLGVALIDTGSQISLVRESSLIRFSREKNDNFKIYGITSEEVEMKGQIKLIIENALESLNQLCYVVESLPRDLYIIFGQHWLDNAGYGFQRKTPVTIPACSEQVIKCRTSEKGIGFIEHQILQPELVCASSLETCENFEFPCLVINLNDQPICMTANPKLEKPPTMNCKQECANHANKAKRLQLLN